MKKETKYFLEGDVSEGLFSDEKGFTSKDVNNNLISGFFPSRFFKGNKLEISLREVNGDKSLIFPPVPDSGGYGFIGQAAGIYVKTSLISK